MDARSLQDLTCTVLCDNAAAANTAAATTGGDTGPAAWIDVTQFAGDIAVLLIVPSLTGSLTGKLQAADDATGTGAADVPGATFAAAVAGAPQIITVNANTFAKKFLGFVGTIVTGPACVSVFALGRKHYVG
jgi:hypothetical protein